MWIPASFKAIEAKEESGGNIDLDGIPRGDGVLQSREGKLMPVAIELLGEGKRLAQQMEPTSVLFSVVMMCPLGQRTNSLWSG